MRGFAPARRGTFVSAKVPKTILARARPQGGPSASAPNKMAQELAPLKQPSPKKSIRYSTSAEPKASKREIKTPLTRLEKFKIYFEI